MLSGTIPLGGLVLVTHHLYFAGPDQKPTPAPSEPQPSRHFDILGDMTWVRPGKVFAWLYWNSLKKTFCWILLCVPVSESADGVKKYREKRKLKKGRRTAERKEMHMVKDRKEKNTKRWRIFLQQHIFEINCFSFRMVFEPPNYSELWNGRSYQFSTAEFL